MRLNNEAEAKRCRGRPQIRSDEETRHLIVEAAAEEFHANGYAATGIADVAKRAGVSTKTLYRLIPTKAEQYLDPSGHCWCYHTQQVLGPDGKHVGPDRCTPGRGCYRSALAEPA